MDKQQPADESPGPVSDATAQPAAPPVPGQADWRGMVIVGGLLAGLGLSIAVAFLMHVVQEASPNGYAMNINGSVLLEVFVAGPVFGLGLAMALAGLIPPASAVSRPASAGRANPTNHPADG